jgi:hypothetical protein
MTDGLRPLLRHFVDIGSIAGAVALVAHGDDVEVAGAGTAAHVVPATGSVTILLSQTATTSPVPPPLQTAFWAYAA